MLPFELVAMPMFSPVINARRVLEEVRDCFVRNHRHVRRRGPRLGRERWKTSETVPASTMPPRDHMTQRFIDVSVGSSRSE